MLRSAGVEPVILVPDVDEDAAVGELTARLAATGATPTPEQTVIHLAETKVATVIDQYVADIPEGAVIIAADSMLLLDGRLQGKPHTVERTVERWQAQRGRAATLITGHAMVHAAPVHRFSPVVSEVSSTVVHFAAATDKDIAAYAATGEPLRCAGAFTLEALGGWFIDRIEGDPSSVIGLSLPVLRRGLEGFGLSVSDLWNR